MSGTNLPPAVFLARASSKKQDESVPSQLAKDLPWFQQSYNVIEVYKEDGISGSKNKHLRTEYLRMLKDLTTGKYKDGYNGQPITICVRKIDRYSREEIFGAVQDLHSLSLTKVKIHARYEKLYDLANADDKKHLIDKIHAGNEEARKTAQGSLQGRIRVFEEGNTQGREIPFGFYKQITDSEGNTTVKKRGQRARRLEDETAKFVPGDEKEQAVVKHIFNLADTTDLSYGQIAKEVLKSFGIKLNRKQINRMVHDEVYAGGSSIGKRRSGKHYVHSAGETVVAGTDTIKQPLIKWDVHGSIVDIETFQRVQQKRGAKQSVPRGASEYILSGILRCGNCGRIMSGRTDKMGRIRYACKSMDTDPESTCQYWTIREDMVLPYLLERMTEVIDGELLLKMIAMPVNDVKDDVASLERELAEKQGQYDKARKRIALVDDDMMKEFQEALRFLKTEVKELQGKIEHAKKPQDGSFLASVRAHWEETRPLLVTANVKGTAFNEMVGYPEIAVRLPVDPATLRQTLKEMQTQVTCYFDRSDDNKRWVLTRATVSGTLGAGLPSDPGTPRRGG
jgi:site-specific DNA recombinase